MYETQYLIVTAIGGVSLLFAIGLYRLHNEVELFSAIAFGCWAVLTFQANHLVVLDQTGTTHTFGSFSMQLITLALAGVSALALIGALTGRWPVTDSQASRREAPV